MHNLLKEEREEIERQIRGVIDEWASAIRAKDINALVSHYMSDSVFFDMIPPLQIIGREAYRKNWEEWFKMVDGEIEYEISNLKVVAGLDAAFSHSINRVAFTDAKGVKYDNWIRSTAGFCKVDGNWVIVHEHVSVPFDMETSEAMMNLKP